MCGFQNIVLGNLLTVNSSSSEQPQHLHGTLLRQHASCASLEYIDRAARFDSVQISVWVEITITKGGTRSTIEVALCG